MEILTGILGAGIGAGIMSIVLAILKRKWQKEDKKEEKEDAISDLKHQLKEISSKIDILSSDVKHVKHANKSILSDRVKSLGTQYLEDGEVEFEDRRILHDLHNAYHNDCDGNGDFDILMRDVDELPLKHN